MGEKLPTQVWSGSFMIGSVEMKVHVLDNGQRIIEAGSVEALFDSAIGDPEEISAVLDLAAFCRGTGIPTPKTGEG